MQTNRRKLAIEWGHCDPAGIVFYPNYFIWFDDCTTHLFAAVGLHPSVLFAERGMVGMPLVDAKARFLTPCRFGDVLDAESEVAEWGRSSLKVAHRFYSKGTLAVEGVETRVWAISHPDDPARIKASPIPADIVARFA